MIFQIGNYPVRSDGKHTMANETAKHYETLTDWVRDKASFMTYPIGRLLGRWGVHPNTVTIAGFILNILAGLVLSTGNLVAGAVAVAAASSVDGLDGALARVSGKKTRFGAFLDSTLDRLSEGALFFGLLVWFVSQEMQTEIYLVYIVILGSVMVSYARARAEGLNIDCKVGVLTRLERIAVLCIGLLFGWVRVMLIVMAVLTWVTFAQRAFSVYRSSVNQQSADGAGQPQD